MDKNWVSRRYHRVAALRGLTALLLLSGCDRITSADDYVDDGLIVARVGAQVIRADAVKGIWGKLPPERIRKLESDAEHRRLLLEPLVRDNVLYEEALRRDVLARPEIAVRVRRLAVHALRQELLAEAADDSPVHDADVRATYDDDTGRYRRPARVRAMGIFVGSQDEAQAIHATLTGQPHDPRQFATLATKHSLHAESKRKGGDLGFLTEDSSGVSPAVIRAALAVKETPGLAPVFQDGDHWVVLAKAAEIPGFEIPFERVKDGIRRQLAQKRQDQWVETYIEQLRQEAAVSIDDDALAQIRISPGE